MIKNKRLIFPVLIMLGIGLLLFFNSCENGLMGELKGQLDENFDLVTYKLTITASSGGSVTHDATIEVRSGETIDISAVPDSGKQFVRWEKTGGSGSVSFGDINTADTTVSISGGDVTIRAVFGNNVVSLSVSVDGSGGSISNPSSSPINVEEGVETSITAVADTGYDFTGWSQSLGPGSASFGSPSLASTTVTVTGGDASIQATFALKTYNLYTTVNDTDLGSVSNPHTSPVSVTHGVERTIGATIPDKPGYYFSGWTQEAGPGMAVFADPSKSGTTVTVTGGDVTIQANYSLITVSLSHAGSYDLDSSPFTARRIDYPKDLVYHDDYVYVLGNFGSSSNNPKVLKIDVSNPANPSYSADNNYLDGTTAREICLNGAYLDMTVSGTGGGVNRLSLSNFGDTTPMYTSDTGANNITPGYWESGDEIFKYNVRDPIQPEEYNFDILYANGYLYASGTDGMGTQGNLAVIDYDSDLDELYLVNSLLTFDEFADELVFGGDLYLYAAAGVDGILTFYVDDDPVIKTDVEGATTNTGEPEHVDVQEADYLFAAGQNSGGYGRLSVFDIHWWNGSDEFPYYLYSRYSYRDNNIIAIDYDGGYLYTLEGTWLVIYEFTADVD